MSTPMPGNAYWADSTFNLPSATKLTVFFTTLPWRNNKKSEEAGYDPEDMSQGVFEERVHIVKLPADPTLRVCRIPTTEDKREYKALYEQYLKTKETKIPGIPIDTWPQISETQKLNFKSMGIMTVDQLANYSDGAGQAIMGFQDIREKARQYLRVGAGQELISQITAAADAKVKAMEEKMAKMEAMLEQLTKPEDAA